MLNHMNESKLELTVVFVHLGPIPKHLRRNLEYFDSKFASIQCYLISNRTRRLRIPSSIKVINSEELMESWPEGFQIRDNRRFFRRNFWFSSKARLLLIPAFMKKYKLSKVLHLESDVWIHPKFPFYLFEQLSVPLAFPLVDETRGIASILYVNGAEGARILSNGCLSWPGLTDMEILGQIALQNDFKYLLPSTYGESVLMIDGWIFDGAKLGMYLFGTDPRNSWGMSYRFRKSSMGDLGEKENIALDMDRLVLFRNNTEKEIANLHLHSKNYKLFSNNWKSYIKLQLIKRNLRMNYGFSFTGTLKAFSEFAFRVFRKLFGRLFS